jgi:hypothetical protein
MTGREGGFHGQRAFLSPAKDRNLPGGGGNPNEKFGNLQEAMITDMARKGNLAACIAVFLLASAFPSLAPAEATGLPDSPPMVIEGVTFPGSYTGDGVVLHLQSAALLRYKIVFRGYVVGLYLPEGADPSSVLEDLPKRMEFSYFWSIPGREFGKAGEKVLARNVDESMMERLRGRLDRIDRAYRDIRPGDRYALTYVPGRGTELSHNGIPLTVIEGADFAAAYFSIWLGEKPLDDGLKKELLRKG